jgi:hypothetical protein
MDSKLPVRHCTGWSLNKIAVVSESVAESPGTSICNMITAFLWPQLDSMDKEDMWFQHDCATCHNVRKTTEFLREKFPGRVILHNGDQNWPPRSCNLTPCNFFLWGFVKSHVYANKPQIIPELKAEIQHVIGEIELQLCRNVIENFVKRARVCQQSCEGHLSDTVFHN